MGADGAPMDDGVTGGRWTYVIFAPSDCDERCQQQLYITRQVRLAMSKDIPRVQRLLVLGQVPQSELTGQLTSDHADLHWGCAATRLPRSGASSAVMDSRQTAPISSLSIHSAI